MRLNEATPSEIRTRYLREHQQLRDAASRLVEQARARTCSASSPGSKPSSP